MSSTIDLSTSINWLTDLKKDDGPNLTEFAHVKLSHEAQELAEDPTDLYELADVLMCVAGIMIRNKWSAEQVNVAINQKIEINKARTWKRLNDGTWQHA
jgi:predicted house-cleaning noncanonical NTP pyrophosphatase (MazG superfamily)